MLEKFVDKLIEEVNSILVMHQLQSNPLKHFSVQASLFSTAMTKLNVKTLHTSTQHLSNSTHTIHQYILDLSTKSQDMPSFELS